MKAKLIKNGNAYSLKINGEYVAFVNEDFIGYATPEFRDNLLGKLSLKNCQAIELGYDLDELANELLYSKYPFHPSNDSGYWLDMYKEGAKTILEILADKKFTYNQMVSAITESSISHRLPSLIIQDLQQTEWDVAICNIMDCIGGNPCNGTSFECNHCTNIGEPKLDADGCLILKRK